MLQKFGLKDYKPVSTLLVVSYKLKKDDESEKTDENMYRQLVGRLLYLIATRRVIMFAASLLARFMHGPSKKQLRAAKRVLRYIQATPVYCDNISVIAMTRNQYFIKELGRRYHYIREALQSNIINLIYCKLEDQLADIFTKALPKDRLCIL